MVHTAWGQVTNAQLRASLVAMDTEWQSVVRPTLHYNSRAETWRAPTLKLHVPIGKWSHSQHRAQRCRAARKSDKTAPHVHAIFRYTHRAKTPRTIDIKFCTFHQVGAIAKCATNGKNRLAPHDMRSMRLRHFRVYARPCGVKDDCAFSWEPAIFNPLLSSNLCSDRVETLYGWLRRQLLRIWLHWLKSIH